MGNAKIIKRYNLKTNDAQQEKVDELSTKIWNFVYACWKKEKDLSIQESIEVQIAALSTCFTQALINLCDYLDFDRKGYTSSVNKLLKTTSKEMLKNEILSKFKKR